MKETVRIIDPNFFFFLFSFWSVKKLIIKFKRGINKQQKNLHTKTSKRFIQYQQIRNIYLSNIENSNEHNKHRTVQITDKLFMAGYACI